MGRHQPEKLTLLSSSSNNLTTSIDENEFNDVDIQHGKTHFHKKIAGAIRTTASTIAVKNRRKLNLNRWLGKRLARVFALMIPILLIITFYSSIFSGASLRRERLSDWDYNVSRNMSEYILPLNDTTLLEPRHKCQEKMLILIIVSSGLNNFVARQTIRETWANTTEFNYTMFEKLHAHLKGKYLQPYDERIKEFQEFFRVKGNHTTTILDPAKFPIRIVFLLGRSSSDNLSVDGNGSKGNNETYIRLQQEAEQYDDIIQENFLDSYNNLTIKSVMALKWAVRNQCIQKAAFFMKCDDDTFVNVPNLFQFLLGGTVPVYNETLDLYDSHTYNVMSSSNRLTALTDYLVGYVFCRSPVLSDIKSRWYMPYYMYTPDTYPTYLSGSGYLMSMDVVSRLYEAALNISLVYLEDVFVTGMCAEKAQVNRRHHPLFNFQIYRKRCTLKGMITLHKLTSQRMYEAYNFVTNMTNYCPPPGKYFNRLRLRRVYNGCD